MNRLLHSLCLSAAVIAAAPAAHAQDVYAEDMLRAEAAKHVTAACPAPDAASLAAPVLREEDASALLCRAAHELPLALHVLEYGCTERSEIIIAGLLEWGVNPQAIGRASTFYDRARNTGGKAVFLLEDAYHGAEFNKAWQMVFGNTIAKKILLRQAGKEYTLDVDGKVQWDIGHIAPTVWVTDDAGRRTLRVLDPVLSPDAPMTLEDWRHAQHADAAALLWGGLGHAPDILAGSLSGEMAERFNRAFNQTSGHAIEGKRMDSVLHDTPPELKKELYAKVLDIPANSAWHPLHWAGYSFAGDDLPDWDGAGDAIFQRRLAAAQAKLAPFTAYQKLRESYSNDEAFLDAVRNRIKAKKGKPVEVFIDLPEAEEVE